MSDSLIPPLFDRLPQRPPSLRTSEPFAPTTGTFFPDRRPVTPRTKDELDRQFVQSFSLASRQDPRVQAEIRRIGVDLKEFGIPQNEVRKNIDEYRKIVERVRLDTEKLRLNSPETYRLLTDPVYAQVAWDLSEELGLFEGLWNDYRRGWMTNTLGKMASAISYRDLTAQEWENIAKYQKKLEDLGSADVAFLTSALTLTGQFTEGAISALPYAVGGAATGAAVGALGGPAVIGTAPAGFSLGLRAGYVANSYQVNSGLAAINMHDRGHDQRSIRGSAIATGIGNALLDYFGAKAVAGLANKTKVGELLRQATSRNPLDKVSIGDTFRQVAGDVGKAVLAETATETAQTLNEMIFEEVSRRRGFKVGPLIGDELPRVRPTSAELEQVQVGRGSRLQELLYDEKGQKVSLLEFYGGVLGDLGDTALEVAQGMAVIGGVGGGVRAARIRSRERQIVGSTQEFLSKIAEAPATLAEREPEQFRRWMQEVVKDTGAQVVKIPLSQMREKLRLADIDMGEAREVLPEIATAEEQARDLGDSVDVVIPMDRLKSEVVTRAGLFEAIKPALRLDDDPLSFEEFQQREEEVRQARREVRRAAEVTEEAEGFGDEMTADERDATQRVMDEHNKQAEEVRRVRRRMNEMVRNAGLSGAEATAATETAMGMLHAVHKDIDTDLDLPLDQWFDSIGFEITSVVNGQVQARYTEPVSPQEPVTAEEQQAPPVSPLTQEAEDFIAKAEENTPAFVTNNLKRIATENGLTDLESKTPQQIVDELKAKKDQAQQQSQSDVRDLEQTDDIRRGSETLEKYGLEPGGKYKVREVAAALEARQRELYGEIGREQRDDQTRENIARWMVAEVLFEFENPEDSGVGWYSTKFQKALDTAGDMFAELKTDKTARNTFTALIAITSDGQTPQGNYDQAADIYGRYRETGELTVERGTARQASVDTNLKVLADLFDRLGVEGAHEFLMQEMPITELRKLAAEQGLEFKSAYQVHIKMPLAAVMFGPKLGAFYANLMGAYGYLTMDRWWSRTFNRYRGTLVQAPTQQGLKRFKRMLRKPRMSDDEAIAATVQYRKSYEAKGFKRGTEIEKAANTIYKMAFENLEDTPFGAKDRTFMLDATGQAKDILRDEHGLDLSIADIQAILWYYEKKLYGELGSRQSAKISYEDAARIHAERRQDDVRGRPDGEDRPSAGLSAEELGSQPYGGVARLSAQPGRVAAPEGTTSPTPVEGVRRELYSEELEPEISKVADEDALVVLHRIEPDEIEGALDLGGLAVPSLGITKAAKPYDGFGRVVLIGTEQLADPDRGNPVFMNDAYSQVFPETYQPIKPGKAERIRKLGVALGEASEQIQEYGGFGVGQSFIDRSIDEDRPNDAIDEYMRDKPAAALVWLGETFPEQYNALRPVPAPYYHQFGHDPQLQEWFKRRMTLEESIADPMDKLINVQSGSALHVEISAEILAAARREQQKLLDAGLRPTEPSVKDLDAERLVDSRTGLVYLSVIDSARSDADRFFGQVFFSSGDATQILQRNKQAIDAWLDGILEDVAQEPQIYVGKKLMPRTLDNVVAAMTRSLTITNKEANFGDSWSFGNARAQSGKARDMRDVLAQRDRIDGELEQQQSDMLRPAVAKWQSQIRGKNRGDGFRTDSQAMRVLGDIVKRRKPTVAHVIAAMKKHGLSAEPIALSEKEQRMLAEGVGGQAFSNVLAAQTVPAEETLNTALDLGKRMRSMATKYLEGKPQRAVRFQEFRGAILPRSTYDRNEEQMRSLGERLERRGVKVVYDDDANILNVAKQLEKDLGLRDGDRILFDEEQQNSDERKRTRRGRYVRRQTGRRITRTIEMMKDANASTIYHELAHVFFDLRLDALDRQAANPEGPQSPVLQETMLAFFEAMGVGPEDGTLEQRREAWNALSEQEQEPFHEAIARNFEIYLGDGVAPTRRQKRLFQRIRVFMTQVYENIAMRVNDIYRKLYGRELFKINAKVRRAFDSMVAAKDDIELELQRTEKPDMEMPDNMRRAMGDRDDEVDIDDLREEAKQTAIDELTRELLNDAEVLDQITGRATSAVRSDARRVRREIKKSIESALMRERVHRLREFLRTGKLTDENGEVIETMSEDVNTRLNSDQVRKLIPGIKLNDLGGAMTSPEGMDLSTVADLFAYDSATEMVSELRDSLTFREDVEAQTQQQMLAEYGNLATPEAVQETVQRAIYNEAKQVVALRELEAVSGTALPKDVTLQAVRDVARQRIGKMRLRDMRPYQFQNDAMRARREAFRQLRLGNRFKAAQAFRSELLYNAMVREAALQRRNADERIRKIERDFARGKDAQQAKTRDMRFIYFGRVMLNKMGMGTQPTANEQQLGLIDEYDKEFFTANVGLITALDNMAVDNPLDLTGDRLREGLDMVEAVWDRSRTVRQIEIAGKRIDRDELARRLARQLKDLGKVDRKLFEGLLDSKKVKAWSFAQMSAMMKRLEQSMMVLDGGAEGGLFASTFYDSLREALDKNEVELRKYYEQLHELMKRVNALEKQAPREIAAPELRMPNGQPFVFGTSRRGDNGAVHEIVTLIANLGNASNSDRLMAGYGWSQRGEDGRFDIGPAIKFINRLLKEGVITREVVDLAQGVMNVFESVKPDYQKALFEIEGRLVPEIQARPFTLQIDGESETFAGGYVPMRYDPDDGKQNVDVTAAERLAARTLNLSSSSSKERAVMNVDKVNLRLDTLMGTFQEHTRFAYVNPAVKRVKDLLNATDVAAEFDSVDRVSLGQVIRRMNPGLYGGSDNSVLDLAMFRAATGNLNPATVAPNVFNNVIGNLRRRMGSIIFTFHARNAAENPLALIGALTTAFGVKPKYFATSFLARFTDKQYIMSTSDMMSNRLQVSAQQIVAEDFTPSNIRERMQSKYAYLLPRSTQQALEGALWKAAHDQWLAEERPNGMSDADAIKAASRFADRKVRLNLGSGDILDAPAYEGAFGEMARVLTQFTGWFAYKNSMAQVSWERFKQDAGLGAYGRFAWNLVNIFYLEFMISAAMRRWLMGEAEEEDDEAFQAYLIQSMILEPMRMALAGAVPIAGDMVGGGLERLIAVAARAVDDDFPVELGRGVESPRTGAFDWMARNANTALDLLRGEFKGRELRAAVETCATILGWDAFMIPATAGRQIQYGFDLAAGNVEPQDAEDVIRGFIQGR